MTLQSLFEYLRTLLALHHYREVTRLINQKAGDRASWFTQGESTLLTVLASLIVPADDSSPGAQDLEVVSIMESIIAQSFQRQLGYSRGLYSIDQWAMHKYGSIFINLSQEAQLSLLKLIDQEYKRITENVSLLRKLSRKYRLLIYARKGLFDAVEFFQTLVKDVFYIFYTSEASWSWLGYDGPPMPLGYPDLAERKSRSDDSRIIPVCSPTRDGGRRILVCLKQVPNKESVYTIDVFGRVKNEAGYYETNQTDIYALEQALILKRNTGAEVTVLSLGKRRVLQTLREALAKGADKAIYVDFTGLHDADPSLSAMIIAEAINEQNYDLVLTGVESDDLAWGQTGVLLAQLLKVPYATIVTNIDVDENWVKATVERELENNAVERVEIALPAVLTVQTSSVEIGRATLNGILQVRKKEIRTTSPKGAGSISCCPELKDADCRFSFPEKNRSTIFLEGSAQEVARALVDKLRKDAKIL